MCIRDRLDADLFFLPHGELRELVDTGALLEITSMIDPVLAVSYTHLRAHETVLDLVCRLLLEKKKNKL